MAAKTQGDATSFDTMVSGGSDTALASTNEDDGSYVPRQYVTGDVTFSSEELLRPRLRLAQGLTQEVQDGSAKPGQWVLNGHDAVDSVVLVPVLLARARELRDETSDERAILCQSGDGMVGHGAPGGECLKCPLTQWSMGDRGKRQPPACTMIWSYVCWSVTHDAAVTVEFKRTAIGIAQFINTMAAHKKLGNFAINLSSRSQKGPRGNYSLPAAAVATVDRETLDLAKAMILVSEPKEPEAF